MPLPKIIGFIGRQGAGKDYACDYLVKHYGFIKIGFSDGVYAAAEALNPWIRLPSGTYAKLKDVIYVYGWDAAKRQIPEIRELLQKVGTEAGRDIHHPDLWVHKTARTIKYHNSYVIRDVRFQNEIDYIRSQGGVLVGITSDMSLTGELANHASEQVVKSLPMTEFAVHNPGGIEYNRKLENLVAEMTQQCGG
jgi:hypothetical protein